MLFRKDYVNLNFWSSITSLIYIQIDGKIDE